MDPYEHPPNRPLLLYTPTNVPGRGCDADWFFEELLNGCKCQTDCLDDSCSCVTSSGGPNYDEKGAFVKGDVVCGPVLECRTDCACCLETCGNRVVQKGPMKGLEIKETTHKGLGLFTTTAVTKGQFVCEYAGEVISEQEAVLRNKEDKGGNYLLFVKEATGQKHLPTFVIDPTCIGNIGRYANHSCSPNMSAFPVRVDCPVPRVALFASKPIKEGEELTFDYGTTEVQDNNTSTSSRTRCKCGSEQCRQELPFHCSLDKQMHEDSY